MLVAMVVRRPVLSMVAIVITEGTVAMVVAVAVAVAAAVAAVAATVVAVAATAEGMEWVDKRHTMR